MNRGGPAASGSGNWDGVLKLRGAPYTCVEDDIMTFFSDCSIAPNGVTIMQSDRGDCSGEVYVQFMDFNSAETALAKDRQTIGSRYVELFKSSNNDRRRCIIENMKKGGSGSGPGMGSMGGSMGGNSMGNMGNGMGMGNGNSSWGGNNNGNQNMGGSNFGGSNGSGFGNFGGGAGMGHFSTIWNRASSKCSFSTKIHFSNILLNCEQKGLS